MVHNSAQHIKIISVWCEELGKSKPCQMELFFRLLNLVVRHKDGKAYLNHFRSIIEDVFFRAVRSLSTKDDDVFGKLQEMVQLWHSKDIFGPQIGDRLQKCLTTQKKLSKLREMFPSQREADLQTALGQCKGNFESVAEYITLQENPRIEFENSIYDIRAGCSWADLVDEEIPEYVSEGGNHSSLGYHRAFDQFPSSDKSPNAANYNSPSNLARRKTIRPPTAAQEYSPKLIKGPDYQIDLSKMGETEQKYIKALEARVKQLEDVVAAQNDDLARTIRNHNKVDEFMKELRIECARLIQRQLNLERGHVPMSANGVFRDSNNKEDDNHSRCVRRTDTSNSVVSSLASTPRLNPQAIPFVPHIMSSGSLPRMIIDTPSSASARSRFKQFSPSDSTEVTDTSSNCNSDVCIDAEDDEQTQQSCESLT
jgi:hypothetical protein